jgi:hypothetical protein
MVLQATPSDLNGNALSLNSNVAVSTDSVGGVIIN